MANLHRPLPLFCFLPLNGRFPLPLSRIPPSAAPPSRSPLSAPPRPQNGYTALIWAAENGRRECAAALIEAGADCEANDEVRCCY